MPKAIGFLFLLMFVPSSFADIMSVTSPVNNPNVGDTFTVDVDVTGITDLYAFQFDLMFDPMLLSAVAVTEGSFLPSGGTTFFIPGIIDNVGGSVSATVDSLIGPISGVTGNGTLAEFQFTALAAGTSALSLANEILLDSSLNDITANTTFQNGSVTVGAPSAVPEPTAFVLLATVLLLLMVMRRAYHRDGLRR